MAELLKILLVDDDLVDRRAVIRALEKAGITADVVEVDDPTEALAALPREAFDCVLLDYHLPKGDGLDLLRQTRALGVLSPVVMLTGQGDEQLAVEIMKAGASDYISKSALSPNRLGRSIVQAVELFRAQQAARQAESSLEILARAGKSLATTLDLSSTLDAIANIFVPEWADYCAVMLRENDGTLSLAASASADPRIEPTLRVLVDRLPLDPRAPLGAAFVARTGQSQLFADFSSETINELVRGDAEAALMLREIGTRSAIVVPLETQGSVVGTLTLGSTAVARKYSQSHLALAEEIGRRAAVAIENSRLFELAQRERRRAEEANRAKDEFLAVVSHEVRTPLNAILGWANMLLRGALDPAQSERAIRTIERNAKAQAQLIDDLLDVSRIITGKLRIEVGPVDLLRVVEAALDVVRPAADAKEVRLQSILDSAIGPIMGDADRLQQVVWNLLSNAVKFTPRRGRVVIRLERVDSSVAIVVEDTGAGIEPAFLPFVFDRFRQAEMRTTRSIGGLGLGLSIVRHIAELHGGKVAAFSEGASKGATFTVTLPVSPLRSARLNAESAPVVSERSSTLPGAFECPPEIAGLKVVVVDDEPDARELLAAMLTHCQAEVFVAASAQEALDMVLQHRPDVLVSDIGMPGEDGYSLIERLRAVPPEKGGRTPAVALTAYTRTEDRTHALLAGFNMHVPKPVDPAELLVVVASMAMAHSKR